MDAASAFLRVDNVGVRAFVLSARDVDLGELVRNLTIHTPRTVEQALALLGGGDARSLAGGTDLIPQLREGRRPVESIIDLKQIPDLMALERDVDGSWRIGAAVTIGSLGRHTQFAKEHPALLAAARLIGSLQIQNRASLGGNLCNAAPSADAIPLMICLDMSAEIFGSRGVRQVPVAAIATDPGRTSIAADELLVRLRLPAPRPRSAARYLRFTPRREMDIAIAGSAVGLALDPAGVVCAARVALASVAPVPLVAESAQRVLLGQRPSLAVFDAAAGAAADDAKPISDARGSADYRRHLVRVLTRRALDAVAADLGLQLT